MRKILLSGLLLFAALTTPMAAKADETGTVIQVSNMNKLESAIKTAASDASESNPYTIEVASGSYTLKNVLRPSDYTTLSFADGVNINCDVSNAYAIRIANSKNVTINGGSFTNAGIKADNTNGLTLENITVSSAPEQGIVVVNARGKSVLNNNSVKKAANYDIYLKGVKDELSITNNTVTTSGKHGMFIENCNYTGDFTGNTMKNLNGKESMGVYFKKSTITGSVSENTMTNCNNVCMWFAYTTLNGDIVGNTITDSKKTGIYAMNSMLNGDLRENTIKRVKGNGIGIYHGSQCHAIDNNVIDTIGGDRIGAAGDYGIVISAKEKKITSATKITNNKISNVTYCGIIVFTGPDASESRKWQNCSRVTGNIEGNVLYNCGTYKPSKNWKWEIKHIKGGKIGCLSGIYVDTHARVYGDICYNKVTKTRENGIYAHLCSYVNNVHDNEVYNVKKDGIQLYKSYCVGDIYNNLVDGCGRNGLRMYRSTLSGDFTNNTLKNMEEKGICITYKSKVEGGINKNTITNTKDDGIYVSDNTTVNQVNGNNLSKIKDTGIYLVKKAVINQANNNNIVGKGTANARGIFVRKGCQIKQIQNNSIQKMGWGIYLEATSPKMQIRGNKLTGNINNVIRVVDTKVGAKKKKTIGKIKIN